MTATSALTAVNPVVGGPGEPRQRGARAAARRGILHLPVYLLLAVASIFSVLPFLWMVIASTHATSDLFGTPLPVLPGGEFWVNLGRLEESVGFSRVMLNSLVIAAIYTVFSSIVSIMCGYGLATYRFRGRGLLLGLVLVTMMIPMQVLLVPLFQMLSLIHI